MSRTFVVDGSGNGIPLDMGYTLYAGGFLGTGEALEPSDFVADGTRSSVLADEGVGDQISAALLRAGMVEEQTIALSVAQVAGPTDVRSADHGEAIVLTAPDLGEARGQVAVVVDEDGAVSFHLPVVDTASQQVETPATRSGGGEVVFVLRGRIPDAPPGEGDATRSVTGWLARKVIHVLSFPVRSVDALRDAFEWTVRTAVDTWEGAYRPAGLRRLVDGRFERHGPGVAEWTDADWVHIQGGRALLFVHGTFSTAHGGFAGLAPPVVDAVAQRYGGRVLALDHPTLATSPIDNVRWFLDRLPSGGIDVDIVSHSRGGLVSRLLAGEMRGLVPDGAIRVRNIVFAGTPNAGTPLADPTHLGALLDRTATVINMFGGPVADAIDAVLAVVRWMAGTGMSSLPGLISMQRGGEFLSELDAGTEVEAVYHAMASDYEPTRPGLRGLLQGAQDRFMDFVFEQEANDLVVPTAGVASGPASRMFPISDDAFAVAFGRTEGVTHSGYWNHAATSDRLATWLPG